MPLGALGTGGLTEADYAETDETAAWSGAQATAVTSPRRALERGVHSDHMVARGRSNRLAAGSRGENFPR